MAVKTKDHVTLLHLSDIHFEEPNCLNLETDVDHPVRVKLLHDLAEMVKKNGDIDAIIVSGDIAYKGHAKEYEVAAKWLAKVANTAGCSPADIYTVPGNHDVSRPVTEEDLVKAMRLLISTASSGHARDVKMHKTISDSTSRKTLIYAYGGI